MKFINCFCFIFILFFSSCSTQSEKIKLPYSREYKIGSYLWVQNSGEYRALCYQTYNLARYKLDEYLKKSYHKKPAIVLDIDETVFDNSFGGARELKNHEEWHHSNLSAWVKQKRAEAVPGAREFLHYAASKKVEILYISNRQLSEEDDTLENFKRLRIPAKKENLYFLTNERSKESRRLLVLKKFDVLLFFGDNLSDFDKGWDDKNTDDRNALTALKASEFGQKFIILPNPLYGDWENALPEAVNKEDLLKI